MRRRAKERQSEGQERGRDKRWSSVNLRTTTDNVIPFHTDAEIRAGELLREMEKSKGAAGGGTKEAPRGRVTQPRDTSPKLFVVY